MNLQYCCKCVLRLESKILTPMKQPVTLSSGRASRPQQHRRFHNRRGPRRPPRDEQTRGGEEKNVS